MLLHLNWILQNVQDVVCARWYVLTECLKLTTGNLKLTILTGGCAAAVISGYLKKSEPACSCG
jgi:hypothetical protein